MPAPLILTFVSTVAFAVQLLIFAYLYSSHRVRFFQYLLLAWGAYTLSKGLKLMDVLVLGVDHPSFVTDLATVAAVGLTLAAAFAHRWSYRLGGRDVLIGTAIGAVFGAWAASLVAMSVPNTRLKPFQKDIDAGKILLMVDVPTSRVEELRELVSRRHPEAMAHGIEPTIPAFP